jgi:tetratricopeptide (TPR) repeat protein
MPDFVRNLSMISPALALLCATAVGCQKAVPPAAESPAQVTATPPPAPSPQPKKHDKVERPPGGITTLCDLAQPMRGGPLGLVPYVFYWNRLRAERPEIILIDKNSFLPLTRPADTVLLTDRITHHYTIVLGVDPEKQEVELSDSEDSFLIEGRNEAGVKARLVRSESGKGPFVRITFAEFGRVVIGLLSLSGPKFADRYFEIAPGAKSDLATQLALAFTMLYAGDSFIIDAQGHFHEAVRLADAAGNAEGKRSAASRLTLCILLARSQTVLRIRAAKDEAQRQTLIASLDKGALVLRELEAKHGFKQDDLLKELSDAELFRLGLAAMAINLYPTAAGHFNDVIGKNPKHVPAYIQRARAKGYLKDFQGAVDDATVALELIDAQTKNATPDESERNLSIVVWTPLILKARRSEALTVRAQANQLLKRLDAVRTDAKEIIALEPDGTLGYILAGNACLASREWKAALEYFRQALAKEKNQSARQSLVQEIERLEQLDAKQDLAK